MWMRRLAVASCAVFDATANATQPCHHEHPDQYELEERTTLASWQETIESPATAQRNRPKSDTRVLCHTEADNSDISSTVCASPSASEETPAYVAGVSGSHQ